MILRYRKVDGALMEFEVGDKPITIGRSAEADVVIHDEKASRLHCGIRMWNGDFYIKDLESKNGTFVNGDKVDMSRLNVGDRIRIGGTTFFFEQEAGKGMQTVLKEVEDEMAKGKGYSTILREIVRDTDDTPDSTPEKSTDGGDAAPPTASGDADSGEDASKARPVKPVGRVAPAGSAGKKVIKLKIRKPPAPSAG